MTFRQLKRDILARVHLNPKFFGERATFIMHDGVEVQASVHVQSERQRDRDEETADRVELIKVLVNRDPDQAEELDGDGNAIGCIDNPQPGLKFIRTIGNDPRPFTFTGEIEDERDHKHRLVFQRKQRIRQGIRQ